MAERPAGHPLDVLARWVADAADAGLAMPATAALATVGADGHPHARTVWMTAVDRDGLRFHTSSPTVKTADLAHEPRTSAVFHWPALGRQVVVAGAASELDREVSEAAYPTRPRPLQLIAWAYEDLAAAGRAASGEVAPGAVEERVAAAAARHPGTPPAPAGWTTYRLVPRRVDFWEAGTADGAPARKTCFEAGSGGAWRSFPALP